MSSISKLLSSMIVNENEINFFKKSFEANICSTDTQLDKKSLNQELLVLIFWFKSRNITSKLGSSENTLINI